MRSTTDHNTYEIYEHALILGGQARIDYIDQQCVNRDSTRAEVYSLLAAADEADQPRFLASPLSPPDQKNGVLTGFSIAESQIQGLLSLVLCVAGAFIITSVDFSFKGSSLQAEAAPTAIRQHQLVKTKTELVALLQSFERDVIPRLPRDMPQLRADLASALATAYQDLGQTEKALMESRQALDLRHTYLGIDHPKTQENQLQLSDSLRLQGRFEEAEQQLRTVLNRRRVNLGEDHSQTVDAYHRLVNLLWDMGRPEEASVLAQRILKSMTTTETIHGPYQAGPL